MFIFIPFAGSSNTGFLFRGLRYSMPYLTPTTPEQQSSIFAAYRFFVASEMKSRIGITERSSETGGNAGADFGKNPYANHPTHFLPEGQDEEK